MSDFMRSKSHSTAAGSSKSSEKGSYDLQTVGQLIIQQRYEGAELLGFETRNKYEILDSNRNSFGFAAEQQKGVFNFLARQFLGHWRAFEIFFFDPQRRHVMTACHPFRFFFQRLEVQDAHGRFLGVIQQRFSLLSKRFDVKDSSGHPLFQIASPLWRLWTFPFFRNDQQLAIVSKKWSGLLSEGFTDKDNFHVDFLDENLKTDERSLILASAMFIDLQYFERKANS